MMGYSVKWVEDNLGITRRALIGFEKAGLMPQNQNNQYRNYSDEDIERIWTIRVLQGMGYSLKEIAAITVDEEFDFEASLSSKVKELEEKKRRAEVNLGYAKTIKLTGRFPSRPQIMGTVTFEEFQEESLRDWNIVDDARGRLYQEIAEAMLTKSPEEFDKTDAGRMIAMLDNLATMETDLILIEHVIPRAIVKRITYGADHPEVQLLVQLIYESQISLEGLKNMSKEQFARLYSSNYMSGDIAKLKRREFGESECEFITEAVAIFGGYSSYKKLACGEI